MQTPSQGPRQFNNADSFAQAFDEAWHEHSRRHPDHGLDATSKMPLILEAVADHPFAAADPATAEQVAIFRIRLLDL